MGKLVNFAKYQVKTEVKKVPEIQEEKILHKEKSSVDEISKIISKSISVSKKPEMGFNLNDLDLRIEKKFNDFNERMLKLMNIGLKHELTIENMIQYFKEIKKTKLYELRRYFSDSNSVEIERILKFLYTTGVISRDKDNWYSLRRESLNGM